MSRLKILYTIIYLCICSLQVAQTLQFDNYTTKNGLISDEVYKIFQDRKGYLWLFTNYGTMKYNGKKFDQVLKNLPFDESFIYSYYENDKNQIWVANSNAKIFEVRNDSAFLVKGTEEISIKLRKDVSEILDLFVDQKNDIYLTTKNAAYRLEKNKNYATSYVLGDEKDSVFVSVFDYDGKILYSINNKYRTKSVNTDNVSFYVKWFANNPESSFRSEIMWKNDVVKPLCFKRYGDEYSFAFYNQLVKVKDDKSVNYISVPSYILYYTKDKKNHFWVGTLNDGLYELDEHDSIVNHYFDNKTINHVVIDSQNGLWVSSDGSGIFHCKNMNDAHFNSGKSFDDGINFIKKMGDDIFLANSTDLFVIRNKKVISSKLNLGDNSGILDIIKCDEGYIICNRFNLFFLTLEPKISIVGLPAIQPAFHPIKLFNISGDSILCISRNKILVLNRGIKSLEEINKVIQMNHKVFSYERRGKDILIGTDNGVYQLINNVLIQPNYLLPTRNSMVINSTRDAYNNIWFCTRGYGLFKLSERNELYHYSVKNGLPSDIINDICFNTDHTVLLSTNRGLFFSLTFKNWMEIYSEQTYAAFCYKNDIYFTTKNGLTIQEDCEKNGQTGINFNLASVFVNGKQTNENKLIELNYNQNNLEFNFDIISFSSSEPDIIYKLEGETHKIAVSKNQQVIFQNLAPGTYTLTASLVGQYNKSETLNITFNIIPAFWQTLWFRTVCVLFCLLIFIYGISRLVRYYRVKENRKNEARRLVTEYKLIALKAQINPHFMSNCLTAIQHLIMGDKIDDANQYLAKFSLLVRQVLNFSSKLVVTLKEELEIAEINIELEQLRFESKFSFEIIVADAVDVNSVFIPPLILQPLIENAIWHGLLPLNKLRQGNLRIEIHTIDDTLHISIEDNGVGRSNDTNNIGNLRESKGIDITKQRIHNLNELFNTDKADLVYLDLVDNHRNAIGTRVTVILPLEID